MYILLYLKCITSRVQLHNTGNSAQCYVAAWIGGQFGGEGIRVYVLLYTENCHNIVNGLYSDIKLKVFLKNYL